MILYSCEILVELRIQVQCTGINKKSPVLRSSNTARTFNPIVIEQKRKKPISFWSFPSLSASLAPKKLRFHQPNPLNTWRRYTSSPTVGRRYQSYIYFNLLCTIYKPWSLMGYSEESWEIKTTMFHCQQSKYRCLIISLYDGNQNLQATEFTIHHFFLQKFWDLM